MRISTPKRPLSTIGLPLAAAGLLVFAVAESIHPGRVRAEPPARPPVSPYGLTVAGVGTVEPQTELISVTADLAGVVRSVDVRAGDRVRAGQSLFRIDDRAPAAALVQAKASLAEAGAAARSAEVALKDERQRLALFESVSEPGAVSQDELARRRFAVERAKAAVDEARARVEVAAAGVRQAGVALDRLTVRAPIAGRVYQVDVRPGEFAEAGPGRALVTLGGGERLHVRAEFDEADAAALRAGATAEGMVRGRPDRPIALTFVRFEPAVREKRALTGGAERVDTRVVQALYAFDAPNEPVFLGQRMDVFVKAAGGTRP